MIKQKRKNPELQKKAMVILHELNAEDITYLSEGNFGEVYKFVLDFPMILQDKKLKSGTYVLKLIKLYETSELSLKEIKYLQTLSTLKLIPKIHIITNDYIIMDYIKGDILLNMIDDLSPKEINSIFDQLEKIITKWHDLGFAHGDLNLKNIMIDNKKHVYLIDPMIYTRLLDEYDFKNDDKIYSSLYNKYSPNFKIKHY